MSLCPLPGVVSFSCPEVLGENGSSKILKLINLVPYWSYCCIYKLNYNFLGLCTRARTLHFPWIMNDVQKVIYQQCVNGTTLVQVRAQINKTTFVNVSFHNFSISNFL